ncbi:MAG: hypothetical protein DCC75_02095 [Proteobacteria bacterium]|nr:MAG: hypothetical protein DCC75_02095 [Pseudomonadota bacterium]
MQNFDNHNSPQNRIGPNTAPALRLVTEEQDFETDEDREGLSDAGQDGNGELSDKELHPGIEAAKFERSLPDDHPIKLLRGAAMQLHQSFGEFIEKSVRQPAGIGFLAESPEPVKIDELLRCCEVAGKISTACLYMPAIDPIMIRAQDLAKDMLQLCQGYKTYLVTSNFGGGVPENQIPEVIHECVGLHRVLGNVMSDLISLSYGVRVGRNS